MFSDSRLVLVMGSAALCQTPPQAFLDKVLEEEEEDDEEEDLEAPLVRQYPISTRPVSQRRGSS